MIWRINKEEATNKGVNHSDPKTSHAKNKDLSRLRKVPPGKGVNTRYNIKLHPRYVQRMGETALEWRGTSTRDTRETCLAHPRMRQWRHVLKAAYVLFTSEVRSWVNREVGLGSLSSYPMLAPSLIINHTVSVHVEHHEIRRTLLLLLLIAFI